jgi:hypothetical protein
LHGEVYVTPQKAHNQAGSSLGTSRHVVLAFQLDHADREGFVCPIIIRDPIEETGLLSMIAQDRRMTVVLFVDPC